MCDKKHLLITKKIIIFTICFILLLNVGTFLFVNVDIVFALNASKTNPVIAWNNLTNQFAKDAKLFPPEISKVLSLLDISIFNALLLSDKVILNTSSDDLIVTGAANTILSNIFPNRLNEISSLKDNLINNLQKFYNKKETEK